MNCFIVEYFKKLSSNGFFVTLQKFYHILATIQFYIQTIILVNLKGWDSFCCILTSRLKFKSFAIGKCVKVITALSVWIIFFSEACLRSRNPKITTKPIFEDAIPVKILQMSLFVFLAIYVVLKDFFYLVCFSLLKILCQ